MPHPIEEIDRKFAIPLDNSESLLSIAISLKRIADTLTKAMSIIEEKRSNNA